MKVHELIEILRNFPQDLPVKVGETDLFGYFSVGDATDVYEIDDDGEKAVRIY